jgi:hypothetical protein
LQWQATALPTQEFLKRMTALQWPCFDDEQKSVYEAFEGGLSSSLQIAASGNSWLLNEVAGLGKEIHYQGFVKKSTKPFGTNNQRKN